MVENWLDFLLGVIIGVGICLIGFWLFRPYVFDEGKIGYCHRQEYNAIISPTNKISCGDTKGNQYPIYNSYGYSLKITKENCDCDKG